MLPTLSQMFPSLVTDVDRNLALQIRACQPLINVVTYEEERFLQQLHKVREAVIDALLASLKGKQQPGSPEGESLDVEEIKKSMMPIATWSITGGFETEYNIENIKTGRALEPTSALQSAIAAVPSGPILVFKDLHTFTNRQLSTFNPVIVRQLRDLAQASRKAFYSGEDRTRCTAILLSPMISIPTELEKDMSLVIYPTPNRSQVERALESFIDEFGARVPADSRSRKSLINTMVSNTVGLTQVEAEDAWRRTMAHSGGELNESVVGAMTGVKKSIIEKSGLLEYLSADESLQTSVGGLDNLKEWVRVRKTALTHSGPVVVRVKNQTLQLNLEKLPPLKGILLVGVPGCGKSLSAKAVATELEMPLVRLDVGRLYEALLGKAEENLRRALRTVDELAPCILWIDEIEKAFSQGGGVSDSGVSSRILGTFLYWMQEKQSTVFVVATANSILKLPPELTRKGRLDEIFYVGLPSDADRKEIFAIHLHKWNIDPSLVDLDRLVKESPKFTGAEVEQAVLNTMRKLQSRSAQGQTEDLEEVLVEEIKQIRPLHDRDKEKEAWNEEDKKAREIAIIASKEHNPVGTAKQTFKGLFSKL
jgi:hypothetical protein